jgi:hypothetical protein
MRGRMSWQKKHRDADWHMALSPCCLKQDATVESSCRKAGGESARPIKIVSRNHWAARSKLPKFASTFSPASAWAGSISNHACSDAIVVIRGCRMRVK